MVSQPALFRHRGQCGENNLGKLTMQVVSFMTNECGWSLVLCNGTNLGYYGEIREQQLKFAAPHPLNLIAPHIMIEMRMAGFIEVNGANSVDIHESLQAWFETTWGATRIKADPAFCDMKFKCAKFQRRGLEGENNMGMCTMQLVDFMVRTAAWTLIACNGGNFGRRGDLREQQLIFRNDAHVRHGRDHIMVELRDVSSALKKGQGYIEVNGVQSSTDIAEPLNQFFEGTWRCEVFDPGSFHIADKRSFCERKYRTPKGFYLHGKGLFNNMGKRTVELAQFMASQGWLLMLCNGGAITEMKSLRNKVRARSAFFPVGEEFEGQINREQQVKFTRAQPGQNANAPILMIELRAVPVDPGVENIPWCIGPRCAGFTESQYSGNDTVWASQTADRRKTRREEVRHWINADTDTRQVCTEKGKLDRRSCVYPSYEQPRWRKLMRTEEQTPACPVFEGFIEVNGPNTNGVHQKLEGFIKTQMRGLRTTMPGAKDYADMIFNCKVFQMKRVPFPDTNPEIDGYYLGENNIGMYTMRLCDFLVDHLGEWDLVVCNGNVLERQWKVDRDRAISMVCREQQLVFRHRGGRRNVFMASVSGAPLGRLPQQSPTYWTAAAREGNIAHEVFPASSEELSWLQKLLDGTYKKVTTRDRKVKMANRFVVVAALRSEHPALWDRYVSRRREVAEQHRLLSEFVEPRTVGASVELALRCAADPGQQPVNEAYMLHGTNPSSALAILGTSFKVDFAGGAAGTMFGPGVYLAEASTKADEYAQDDAEGTYKGLFAMLVCRAIVGKPFVTQQAGNWASHVTSGAYDCVLGDREAAVGTFREFIFFHESSIYPEYVVLYQRNYEDDPGAFPAATLLGFPGSTATAQQAAAVSVVPPDSARSQAPAHASPAPAASPIAASEAAAKAAAADVRLPDMSAPDLGSKPAQSASPRAAAVARGPDRLASIPLSATAPAQQKMQ